MNSAFYSKRYFGLSAAAWIFAAAVLIAHIVVRTWFAQDHLFFHGEQARDYLVITEAWLHREWIMLGPIQADTGGVHLGPGYYYLLLLFALPFGFHPVSGLVMTTTLFLAAWLLVFWYIGTRHSVTHAVMFGSVIALSETVFLYSSYALNMNVLFFFEAVLIIGLLEFYRARSRAWLTAAGIALVCLLQLHLSALVLLPALIAWLIVERKTVFRDTAWVWPLGIAIVFGLVSYAPMLVYDIRSGDLYELRKLFYFLFVSRELSSDTASTLLSATDTVNANARTSAFLPIAWVQTCVLWVYASLVSHTLPKTAVEWLAGHLAVLVPTALATCMAAVTAVGYAIKHRVHLWLWLKALNTRTHGAVALLTCMPMCMITAAAVVHSTSVRHYILILPIPLLVLASMATWLWRDRGTAGRVFVVLGFVAFGALNIWNARADFAEQQNHAINEPYEGFSSTYNIQQSVASDIARAVAADAKKNPEADYVIRAAAYENRLLRVTKQRTALRDVMHVHIGQALGNPPYLASWESKLQAGSGHRVVYIVYTDDQTPAQPNDYMDRAPVVQRDGYTVYITTSTTYNDFTKKRKGPVEPAPF